METVRDLDWDNIGFPQNAQELFESNAVAEKEGFEPSFDPTRLVDRADSNTLSLHQKRSLWGLYVGGLYDCSEPRNLASNIDHKFLSPRSSS